MIQQKKIAEGVYDDRVDIKGKDEIGELGKTFQSDGAGCGDKNTASGRI